MNTHDPKLLFMLSAILCLHAIRSESKTKHPESLPRDAFANLTIPFMPGPSGDDPGARFVARTFGGSACIRDDGRIRYHRRNTIHGTETFFRIEEEFVSADVTRIEAKHPASTRLHLFQGKEADSWRTSVPTYETVEYENAYEGIDIRLRARPKNIEKQFILHPGANPDAIRVKVHGADRLGVNGRGELEVRTTRGTVRFTKPVAFQETGHRKTCVDVAYVLEGDTYRFEVGAYDASLPLLIDPLLASTFLGGEDEDMGYAVALDADENVFVAGGTASADFATAAGGGARWDVFIAKFDPDLTTLESVALLGGSGDERAYDILIDGNENVIVSGSSVSPDFPTTSGAFSGESSGHYDGFLLKMDNDLSALQASTLLGGEYFDGCYALALADNGEIYTTGMTYSSDFPTTEEAYDRTYASVSAEWLPGDAVVSRLDNDLSTLLASTFLGGNGFDWGLDIVWHDGALYIGGETKAPPSVPGSAKFSADTEPESDPYIRRKTRPWESPAKSYIETSSSREDTAFPSTPGAFDETPNGETDVFIARMDAPLNNLEAATLIGGRRADLLGGIGVGLDGRLILGGSTLSSDFPSRQGGYDTSYNGFFDAYIAKLDPSLGTLEAATFYGGSDSDVAEAFTIKGNGYIYIAGYTASPDLPMHRESFDSTHTEPGIADIFIARFSSDLVQKTAATLLGGEGHQDCTSIVTSRGHHVYITGTTRSQDLPTSTGAFASMYGGGSDAYVLKIDRYLSNEDNWSWNTQRMLFYPPYPNPFQTRTTIRIDLPNPTPLSVKIYDLRGECVWTLPTNGTWEPGLYDLHWGGENRDGIRSPSGHYICRIRTNDFDETRKIILLQE